VSLFERFSRNASYMVGGTVLQRLLLGVGAVLYARLLGAEQYGIYVNVFSLVTILTAVCQFGVPSSFTAILPQVETTSPHRAPLVVGAGLALVGGFLTVSALVLWRGAGFLSSVVYHDQIPRLLFLIAIPFLLVWTMQTVLASVLQGFQHFRFHAVQSVALGLFIVTGSVAGILLDNVRGALVGASIGYAAGLALVFRYVHRHWGIRFQGVDGAFRATLAEVRAFAVPAFIGGLFVAPAYWVGNVLLVRAGGVHWSGIYGVANTLAQLALFIPVTIAAPLVPLMSEVAVTGDRAALSRFTAQNLRMVWALALPTGLLAGGFGPLLITVLYGSEYADSVVPYLILSATNVLIAVTGVGGFVLMAKRRMWEGALINAVWFGSFVLLSVLLIDRYAVNGLALAFLASYIGFVGVTLVVVRRHIDVVLATSMVGNALVITVAGFVLIGFIVLLVASPVLSALASLGITLLFTFLVWRFGLTADDRTKISDLVQVAAGRLLQASRRSKGDVR